MKKIFISIGCGILWTVVFWFGVYLSGWEIDRGAFLSFLYTCYIIGLVFAVSIGVIIVLNREVR